MYIWGRVDFLSAIAGRVGSGQRFAGSGPRKVTREHLCSHDIMINIMMTYLPRHNDINQDDIPPTTNMMPETSVSTFLRMWWKCDERQRDSPTSRITRLIIGNRVKRRNDTDIQSNTESMNDVIVTSSWMHATSFRGKQIASIHDALLLISSAWHYWAHCVSMIQSGTLRQHDTILLIASTWHN